GTPGNFLGTPGNFLGTPGNFLGTPENFLGTPENFLGIPKTFWESRKLSLEIWNITNFLPFRKDHNQFTKPY
ncbi:MAG: hypothetical protein LBU34_10905, partial [Planctomycetaceae bacterium]|nr:hypothetical protein [Planctomycetaceae bacterium]